MIGLNVDLVLQNKKPKWVFTKAEKIGAGTIIIITYYNHLL